MGELTSTRFTEMQPQTQTQITAVLGGGAVGGAARKDSDTPESVTVIDEEIATPGILPATGISNPETSLLMNDT